MQADLYARSPEERRREGSQRQACKLSFILSESATRDRLRLAHCSYLCRTS